MNRIKTNTTDFKRALKTITDILTASEKKEHNLDIGFQCKLGLLTMSTKHPIDDILVKATFEVEEPTKDEDLFVIHLGELTEILKKYRKKEDLFISIDGRNVTFGTNEEDIYETNSIDTDFEDVSCVGVSGVEVNRKHLIEGLNMSRSVNRSTFHDSSMVVKFAYTGKELLLYATNFAQIVVSTIHTLGEDVQSFDVNLPTNLLTKVRNTISRGSGENVIVSEHNNWLTIETNNSVVQFKGDVGLKYVNFNNIISSITWDEEVYSFNTKENKTILDDVYSKLREAEDSKDEDLIKTYSSVHFNYNDKQVKFSEEEQEYSLFTRDFNSIVNRLPSKLDVAISKEAVLFKHDYEHGRMLLLVPYNNN